MLYQVSEFCESCRKFLKMILSLSAVMKCLSTTHGFNERKRLSYLLNIVAVLVFCDRNIVIHCKQCTKQFTSKQQANV